VKHRKLIIGDPVFPLVRSAIVIGSIFVLSPVKTERPLATAEPAAPAALRPAPSLSVDDAARLWSSLPQDARARLTQEIGRLVLDDPGGQAVPTALEILQSASRAKD
jgi:hypothetical protein